MEATVRYLYRIRPGAEAVRVLNDERDRNRWVWNNCVGRSKDAKAHWYKTGPATLCLELSDWRNQDTRRGEWLRGGSAVAQQQTIRDFGLARAKAIKDIAEKLPMAKRRGMPRYRSGRTDLCSLAFTKAGGFKLTDRTLRVAGVDVAVVLSRLLPSAPTSVRVYQDTSGYWWASFVVIATFEPLPKTGYSTGIDWGVKQIATARHADHDLDHPEHGKKLAESLAKSQRKMARRRPSKGHASSEGYKTAKRETARLYQKVACQRADTSNKWAHRVAADCDQIAVEDFKPRFLAQSTMARKAADAGIGAAKSALLWQAKKAGRETSMVVPAYSTMDCGKCGARAKHRLPLSQRTFVCEDCGHVAPRDRNSADVVHKRAGFGPVGVDCGRPDRTKCVVAA